MNKRIILLILLIGFIGCTGAPPQPTATPEATRPAVTAAPSTPPSSPAGIPGSPCKTDADCIGGLKCKNFMCSIPSAEDFIGGVPSSGMGYLKPPGECEAWAKCDSKECMAELLKVMKSELDPATQTMKSAKESMCYLFTSPVGNIEELKRGVKLEQKYPNKIKSTWEPGAPYNRLAVHYFATELRELGVNTYHIIPSYIIDKDKKVVLTTQRYTGERAKEEVISNILRAKKEGFAVILVAGDYYPLFKVGRDDKTPINMDDYEYQMEGEAIKWAGVAEEYKVEYYAPVNEFEYYMYDNDYPIKEIHERTNKFYSRVIPKVREFYSGKIYCKVGSMDAQFDGISFRQCDLFGIGYGTFTEPPAQFAAKVAKSIIMAEAVSARDGVPYIYGELFVVHNNVASFKDYYTAAIQAYRENAKTSMGLVFMGWIQGTNEVRGTEATPLIKELFKTMGD
ncbi:MAG: hypothetical protein HY930_05210 [Euryarchaeota archaeon]|nr:hypothetical protein [Euryarchaeota archaeon]